MRAVQHSINPERSVSHSIPKSTLLAAALLVLSLPVLASDCIDPIAAIGLSDGRTGAPIRSDWFLEAVPQSQTITGHDFDAPVVIPNHQRTFLYVPEQPGEKHLTLTVVTECGTFSRTGKYHVQQCNVVAGARGRQDHRPRGRNHHRIDRSAARSHRALVVRNGTPSSTEGASIDIVAGSSGTVRIDVFVTRGKSEFERL